MEAEARPNDEQVIWCEPCGMPHARGTTHCISCGAPLGEEAPAAAAVTPAVPVADSLPPSAPVITAEPVAPPPPRADVAPRGRRSWRAAPPMSETEIEATAAAIVARAMVAGEAAPAREPAGDGQATPPPVNLKSDSGPLVWPDPLPPSLPSKDRLWLIAGGVCCVILLLALIVFARTMPYAAH
jgi:hypothetical protein